MNALNSNDSSRTVDSATKHEKGDRISLQTIWNTAELWAWLAIVTMPVLYWISGEAVSRDQAAIRWIMIVVAFGVTALSIGVRLRSFWLAHRD